jgi:hypothetical protein
MAEDILYTLVPLTNRERFALDRGRFALDRPEGRDITSSEHIAVRLGGAWIPGNVEHSDDGYYFVDSYGLTCGLRVGMLVKLL